MTDGFRALLPSEEGEGLRPASPRSPKTICRKGTSRSRGVSLLGIDSAMQPRENRIRIWQRIAEDLPPERLDAMTTVHPLADVPELAARILEGAVRGRTVIYVRA